MRTEREHLTGFSGTIFCGFARSSSAASSPYRARSRPVFLPPNQSVWTPFFQLDIRINEDLLFPVLPYRKRHTSQVDIFACIEGVYMEPGLLRGRLDRGVHVAFEGARGVCRESRHVDCDNDGSNGRHGGRGGILRSHICMYYPTRKQTGLRPLPPSVKMTCVDLTKSTFRIRPTRCAKDETSVSEFQRLGSADEKSLTNC